MKIEVPDGWNEISISQFQEISEVQSGDESDKFIQILSIILNYDPDDIRKMDIDSLNKILPLISWATKIPADANYKPIIEIDGEKYGFISRLSDLKTGEWIDLEFYLQDVNKNLHKIFAILYRPLVVAYNDKDRLLEGFNKNEAHQRAELFKEKMMVGDVYGALVFFCLIEQEFIKVLTNYFQSQTLTKTQRLIKWMGGFIMSILWPKGMSQKWSKYLTRILNSPSSTKFLRSITRT